MVIDSLYRLVLAYTFMTPCMNPAPTFCLIQDTVQLYIKPEEVLTVCNSVKGREDLEILSISSSKRTITCNDK